MSTLGTAADVVHEALYVGVELFDLAPVPGLSLAARTLLNIWDAAQNVDVSRRVSYASVASNPVLADESPWLSASHGKMR